MKEYVCIKTVRDGNAILPASILFRNRHYPISEVIKSSFYQGETTFVVRIGKQITNLYRDEFTNRWFVIAA